MFVLKCSNSVHILYIYIYMCVLKTPEIAFRKLEKYFIIMLKTPEIETFQM